MSDLDVDQLATILRELRGGLSQAKAAKKARIPLHTVERLENAKTENPSFENIAKLCAAYAASLDQVAADLDLVKHETSRGEEATEAIRVVIDTLEELGREEQRELADMLIKSVNFYTFGRKPKEKKNPFKRRWGLGEQMA